MKFPAKAQRRKESVWLGFSLLLCAFAGIILLVVDTAAAQPKLRSRVTISITSPEVIRVDAELLSPARSWSFRNAYAGALGFAERVEDFRAFTASGQDARVRKSAVGEFRSDLEATRISYEVRLSNPRPTHIPHVSWLAGDHGVLMFADLVPLDIESLSAAFELPTEWTIASSVAPDSDGRYEVSAPEKSLFFVGRSVRKTAKSVDGMMVETVQKGTWRFKDDEALKAATVVMEKYVALTGYRLPDKSVIMIAPAPVSLGTSTWKAETRGSTVVVLMDPNARHNTWIGQVKVIFTHELLHLWVPNSLKLEGDYDWFFEGFTMYVALRTALELKVIKFKGFLDTLGGAYKYYLDHPDTVSLVEASETRWTSGVSHVYIKGMLVAFLYDLMLRKASGGKATLADRYRELFNGIADGASGNEAIIKLLGSSPALKDFTKSYIENRGQLKLEQLLPAYGLQLEWKGQNAQLKVSSKLDEDQKQVLRSLGY